MNKQIIIVLLFLLMGCSQKIRVYTYYDPDYDFWGHRTFYWAQVQVTNIEANPFLYYNELHNKRIKLLVLEQMTTRGYTLSENNPDLILHYHILLDDPSAVNTEKYGTYNWPFWLRKLTDSCQCMEGTFILHLMDAKTNHVVWRGCIVTPIETTDSTDQIDHLLDTAIPVIFNKYPLNESMLGQPIDLRSTIIKNKP